MRKIEDNIIVFPVRVKVQCVPPQVVGLPWDYPDWIFDIEAMREDFESKVKRLTGDQYFPPREPFATFEK